VRTRSVRGFATASLSLATVAALASCSAGVDAGTLDPQRLNGAHVDVGMMKIRNAVVVGEDGEGELMMTIVNDGTTDDALTGVEVEGAEVSLEPSTVDLPAETAVVFPGGEEETSVAVEGELAPGAYVTATFSFESAGSRSVPVLVLSEAAIEGGN